MKRLSGVLLILSGISIGAYAYLPEQPDGAAKLRELTRISAAPDREARALDRDSVAAVTGLSVTAPTAVAPAYTQPAKPSTWTTVVSVDNTGPAPMTSSRPGDGEARADLARSIQRELKRVGCYGGDITGLWNPSTRRAMSAFMDRVNATLPVDQPDYILLTLVQGHKAAACGAPCPKGQVAADAGRCVPTAVMAQSITQSNDAARVPARDSRRDAASGVKVVAAPATPAAPVAASKKSNAAAERSIVTAEAARAIAAAAAKEELPWLARDATQDAPRPRGTPPPGMMAVGAPTVVAKAEMPETDAVVRPAPATRAPITIEADDRDQADDSAAPRINPPAAAKGLPGSKSGVAARTGETGLPGDLTALKPARNAKAARNARALRRLAAPARAVKPPKGKFSYYAQNSGGKGRRDQPRPGTPRYNLMQSLGGIY